LCLNDSLVSIHIGSELPPDCFNPLQSTQLGAAVEVTPLQQ
jgi:hypothetical protein